ncbi:MAG TPA: hypothetical protein VFA44_12190 [Gaiellaceae bacterium]|nr:hypothetical protein [Gaiellaceae bacterium]
MAASRGGWEMEDSFGLVIKQHLELRRRNRALEREMPLERYRDEGLEGPARSHSPASAGLEETQEWAFPDETGAPSAAPEPLLEAGDELWSGSPSFDWGDE